MESGEPGRIDPLGIPELVRPSFLYLPVEPFP